jgi:hypothetical protein
MPAFNYAAHEGLDELDADLEFEEGVCVFRVFVSKGDNCNNENER